MRVAYICADPGIPVFGTKGASVHVQEVVKAMLSRGLDVTLFAQRLGGDVPEALKNVPIRKLETLPKDSVEIRARAALAANAKVKAMLEAEGPFDMVYERYSLWSSAGMDFAKKHGCAGILEVNAPLIEEQKKHRELPLEDEAQRIAESVFAAADAMIAVSPGVKQYLETFEKARGRVHVVANGVALDRFAPAAEKKCPKAANPHAFFGSYRRLFGHIKAVARSGDTGRGMGVIAAARTGCTPADSRRRPRTRIAAQQNRCFRLAGTCGIYRCGTARKCPRMARTNGYCRRSLSEYGTFLFLTAENLRVHGGGHSRCHHESGPSGKRGGTQPERYAGGSRKSRKNGGLHRLAHQTTGRTSALGHFRPPNRRTRTQLVRRSRPHS